VCCDCGKSDVEFSASQKKKKENRRCLLCVQQLETAQKQAQLNKSHQKDSPAEEFFVEDYAVETTVEYHDPELPTAEVEKDESIGQPSTRMGQVGKGGKVSKERTVEFEEMLAEKRAKGEQIRARLAAEREEKAAATATTPQLSKKEKKAQQKEALKAKQTEAATTGSIKCKISQELLRNAPPAMSDDDEEDFSEGTRDFLRSESGEVKLNIVRNHSTYVDDIEPFLHCLSQQLPAGEYTAVPAQLQPLTRHYEVFTPVLSRDRSGNPRKISIECKNGLTVQILNITRKGSDFGDDVGQDFAAAVQAIVSRYNHETKAAKAKERSECAYEMANVNLSALNQASEKDRVTKNKLGKFAKAQHASEKNKEATIRQKEEIALKKEIAGIHAQGGVKGRTGRLKMGNAVAVARLEKIGKGTGEAKAKGR